MASPRYIVAAFEIDRAYGGPEEGGWWFNTGRRERILRMFRTEDAAYDFARRFNTLLGPIQQRNRHVRDIGSVIYDGGRFQAEVWGEDELPEVYPVARPHYE